VNKVKKLLVLAAFIWVLIFIFKEFDLKSKLNYMGYINNDYETTKTKFDSMAENIKLSKYYEDKKSNIMNEIESTKVMEELEQEQVIEIIGSHLNESGIEASRISFSEVVPISSETSNTENLSSDVYSLDSQAGVMSVTVEFSTSYENMMKFIDSLQSDEKEVVITNIRIVLSEKNDVFTNLQLKFYAVPLNFKG
jgi:type IV pilus assembly protein PilO